MKEFEKLLKKMGLDVREVRVTGVQAHPIYDYCTVTGEVYTGKTVLPFRLPVTRSLGDTLLNGDGPGE